MTMTVRGICLPAGETHFARHPDLGARYPVLDRALALLPVDRRRTAVDVGAHVGLWSRWLVKEFETVHAFEPVADYLALLRKNIPERNIVLHACALGVSTGSVAIKLYPDNTGQAHVQGPGAIPMWPLDCFRLQDVDLIKIDVEGYELPVIKGGVETLRRCRPLVVIEQRGCDVVNFGGDAKRDEARTYLEQEIGMRVIDALGADLVMGWPA